MDVGYLIQMLNNKLSVLITAKDQAFMAGDFDRITAIDAESLSVQNTLAQLNLVQQITNAAAAANTTPADVIANGLNTIQNTPVIPDSPTAVLAMYDLSTYASDPLYLQKITDILNLMPIMDSTSAVDTYISNEAIGSPLSGQVILSAAQQYNIDARLLMAILELESNFGTAGVAVSTMNPGNVGNTGSGTRTYTSWQDGVAAVAQWLSYHPSTTTVPVTPDTTTTTTISSIPTITPPVVVPTVPMDPTNYTQATITTTSSGANSTTTPTSTDPSLINTQNSTSTPTSTPIAIPSDQTATPTSTPPSTDPSLIPDVNSTSTPTSTPFTLMPDPTSTSTPTSTPPDINSGATSTPATNASSTVSMRKRKSNYV